MVTDTMRANGNAETSGGTKHHGVLTTQFRVENSTSLPCWITDGRDTDLGISFNSVSITLAAQKCHCIRRVHTHTHRHTPHTHTHTNTPHTHTHTHTHTYTHTHTHTHIHTHTNTHIHTHKHTHIHTHKHTHTHTHTNTHTHTHIYHTFSSMYACTCDYLRAKEM